VSVRPGAWGREGRELLRELGERVAQAVAHAYARKQGPHTLGGAIKAIGENPVNPIGRLLLERRALELLMGLGQGRRTGVLRVAQMPDDAATDDRGEVHFRCQAVAVFFIRQDIRRQRQPTPRQHRDQTLLTEGTDQTIESHGREMADDCAQLQTEATMAGHQGIASDLGSHLAIAQDEMRQDGEHGFARRALDTPDGDSTHTDAPIMRVAGQAPVAATGRLMFELKAKGEEKGEDEFDKRLAVVKELKVGRFIVEIDGDGAVVPHPCGSCAHVLPPDHQVASAHEIRWGQHVAISRQS
jgi:hypothetical protein